MRYATVFRSLLFSFVLLVLSQASFGQVAISVNFGPPAIPVYEQPICPGDGYIWTPGYWAYDDDDGYYWVPGTWVEAPEPGYLWTPGWWGWGGSAFLWHAGYWGPHVGFYGGINYGFGYGGVGFVGGRWNGGVFAYNTAVMHVNTTVIHNTYVDRTVINNVTVNNHVSYNGGTGGVSARATSAELAAEHEHHIAPTSMQTQHEHAASTNRALLASENHGRPAIAATARPGEFSGHGVVAAKEYSHAGSPNGGNKPANNAANLHKTDRPPSHTPSAGANPPHTNSVNASHANNGGNNPPKNQPHPQSKPQTESKPRGEGKPPKEGRPR